MLIKSINDDQHMLMNEELIGLEAIWHIFFGSENKDIIKRAMDFLMQIIKFRTNNVIILNNLKELYVEKIFS
jgi:hypothetical protein